MTTSTQKRTRVEYTAQFAATLAELIKNQTRLEQNQMKLEETLAIFLAKQTELVRTRNHFVLWGVTIAVFTSVVSVLISIFK